MVAAQPAVVGGDARGDHRGFLDRALVLAWCGDRARGDAGSRPGVEPFARRLEPSNSWLHTSLVQLMGEASVALKRYPRAKRLREFLLSAREEVLRRNPSALRQRDVAEARVKWVDLTSPQSMYSGFLAADREMDRAAELLDEERARMAPAEFRRRSAQLVDDKIWSLMRLASTDGWSQLAMGPERDRARGLHRPRRLRALEMVDEALIREPNSPPRLHTHVEVHGQLHSLWAELYPDQIVTRVDRLRDSALALGRLAPNDCGYQSGRAKALEFAVIVRARHGENLSELVDAGALLRAREESLDAMMCAFHLDRTSRSAAGVRRAAIELATAIEERQPGRARSLVRLAIPLCAWPPRESPAQVEDHEIPNGIRSLARRLGLR